MLIGTVRLVKLSINLLSLAKGEERMSKTYTGIGSRDISEEELDLLVSIAEKLAYTGWKLRSGGAEGADTAFEKGCAGGEGQAEIFIPWKGFGTKIENANSKRYIPNDDKFQDARRLLLTEEIIPWFDNMKQGAQKLHARNVYQVLGTDNTKSDLLVYCADDDKNGIPKGGTRTAVLLAREAEVPTYNVRNEEQRKSLLELIYEEQQ